MIDFTEPQVPTVEAEVVKKAMDEKAQCVLLDVRTTGEYSRGKLEGSINLPVDEVSAKVETEIPDKTAKIYVYCLSGSRSAHAVDVMKNLGYTNVFHMNHGLLGWRAKYFPVVA
jgi:rhodanese-related sulfurtransferase